MGWIQSSRDGSDQSTVRIRLIEYGLFHRQPASQIAGI
jgi:hypothetical protein